MEEAVAFPAAGKQLFGILHRPDSPARKDAALLMIVGGPQTRVGSHRSYTLMARDLCDRGIPVLRFDYEGLGDSEGAFVGFSEAGPSLEAAVSFLAGRIGPQARIVLWALCDGSAACALQASRWKPPVAGLILCNPYVHSAQGKAKAYLKHYYIRRALDPSFWKKLLSFRVNPVTVLLSFAGLVAKASARPSDGGAESAKEGTGAGSVATATAPAATGGSAPAGSLPGASPPGASPAIPSPAAAVPPASAPSAPSVGKPPAVAEGVPGADPDRLPEKVMEGLEGYRGPLELILSGDDLTAREFLDLYRTRGTAARRKPARTETALLPGADHTFTAAAWKRAACDATAAAWDRILGGGKEAR